ncbi:hypothetical protein BLNAU_17567 [Blattamonas nauphoetae]|uniref:Uncharacterized protein n=1 Tax=Blattamonas nauphoetae TaxID=2049346 RepID=A0ABQ9X6S1_9EUKA|nr:hypothetical protein BLNAU_17567 [Blattamonas nauphoetae]
MKKKRRKLKRNGCVADTSSTDFANWCRFDDRSLTELEYATNSEEEETTKMQEERGRANNEDERTTRLSERRG